MAIKHFPVVRFTSRGREYEVDDATMLITSFNNLSIYWQKGTMRRLMKDEPEYNRIATYQSINDAYVVEDYGKCAMVTGLKFADS